MRIPPLDAGLGWPEEPGDWQAVTRTFRDGQSYKQVKDELGWADFQVCSDVAIRRRQVLVLADGCGLVGLPERSSVRSWLSGPHRVDAAVDVHDLARGGREPVGH